MGSGESTDAVESDRAVLRDRDANPERAFALVRRRPASVDVRDGELMQWLGQRCRPGIPPELVGVFERGLEERSEVRRTCLQKLAATAYYEGRTEDARRIWLTAAEEGRAASDRLWFMALNNLALMARGHGLHFEALVLSGMSLRGLPEDDLHAIAVFAFRERVCGLLEHDDVAASERTLERGLQRCRFLDGTKPIDGAALSSLDVARGQLAVEGGRLREALEVFEQVRRAGLETRAVDGAVQLTNACRVLEVRFELEPENRPALFDRFEALEGEYEARGDWKESFFAAREFLRWRLHAEGARAGDAARAAERFFEHLPPHCSFPYMRRAIAMLERHPFDDAIQGRLTAHAADFLLERLDASQREAEELPIQVAATAEDWNLLAGHHARLLAQPHFLRPAFASRWRTGLPAFDRLVDNGYVVVCAWCGRTRTNEGNWLPATEVFELVTPESISHGICESCVGRAHSS